MESHSRAHVFVVREGLILAIQQASGSRWWEFPGGDLERGELPADAAMRETLEETGLHIEAPALLRQWSYENRRGEAVACWAFVAEAGVGEVALSSEHNAFQWLSVDAYERQYCGEATVALAPNWARPFLAEIRRNCVLFRDWQQRQAMASPAE